MKKLIKNPLVKPKKMKWAKLKGTATTVASLCIMCAVFFTTLLSSCEKKVNCLAEITGVYAMPQEEHFNGNLEIIVSVVTLVRQESCGKSNTDISHTISSFSIKTIYDYSANFLAGSDITSLFESKYNKYDSDFITIDEIIQLINNNLDHSHSFFVFLTDDTYKGEEKKLKFEIKILLSDDKEFVYQTDDLSFE